MSSIHFVTQGKGGVGKTLVSAQIAQRLIELGIDVTCLNVDPVNQSFAQYQALNVQSAHIIDSTGKITDKFDRTIDQMVNSNNHFVVDTGASAFSPLTSYIFENQILEILNNAGKTVFFHIPITGGPAQDDTLTGLYDMLQEFEAEKANFVIWENRYFGEIKEKGQTFRQMKVYNQFKDRIENVISFGEQRNLFTQNFTRLNSEKLTYQEAAESPDYSLMEKHRLVMMKREIFTQIDDSMKKAGIGV